MPSNLPKACCTASSSLFAIANAAIGCGLGLIVSDKLNKNARQTVALSAIAAGLAATVPLLIDLVSEQVTGPNTDRGLRNRLRSIREDSGFSDEVEVA
jgi:hypothetical protein